MGLEDLESLVQRDIDEKKIATLQRQLAEARAEAERRGAALLAVRDELLGSPADSGDPKDGARVEAECPHESDNFEGCPWEDIHRMLRLIRAALQPPAGEPTEQPAEAGDHNHNQGN